MLRSTYLSEIQIGSLAKKPAKKTRRIKTIKELNENHPLACEEFFRQKYKYGVTFKEFVTKYNIKFVILKTSDQLSEKEIKEITNEYTRMVKLNEYIPIIYDTLTSKFKVERSVVIKIIQEFNQPK